MYFCGAAALSLARRWCSLQTKQAAFHLRHLRNNAGGPVFCVDHRRPSSFLLFSATWQRVILRRSRMDHYLLPRPISKHVDQGHVPPAILRSVGRFSWILDRWISACPTQRELEEMKRRTGTVASVSGMSANRELRCLVVLDHHGRFHEPTKQLHTTSCRVFQRPLVSWDPLPR
jgi:hypothetical protein